MEPTLVNAYPVDAAATCEAFVESDAAYLLVDQAMAPEACASLLHSRTAPPYTRVFEGRYAGEDVAGVSPLLLALPEPDAERAACIRRWLRITNGLPMLSVIKVGQSLAAVNEHLQAQLEAEDPDGTVYLVRWADTRSLTLLRRVLTDAQRGRLMGTLRSWAWFDRDGTWTVMERDEAPQESCDDTVGPYRLDERQVEAVRTASMADTLLRYVHETRRGFEIRATPAQMHGCIERTLDQLRHDQHGMPGIADCCRTAVASLLAEGLVAVPGGV